MKNLKLKDLKLNNEMAMIYRFDELELEITIVNADETGKLEEVCSDSFLCPEHDMYGDDYEADEDELQPRLNEIVASDLDAYMMDKYLRELGIFGESEQDEEAFYNLHQSESAVREELRHSNVAHIMYKNWYLEITDEYPIERFEKLFKPILHRNDSFMENFLKGNGICVDDISKVILTGSECEYPFVRAHLEHILGRKCIHMKNQI